MTVRLLTGDCRAVLATLPDASVQLCVTSPPYFGLRDYQTASWEGGDAACDHIAVNTRRTFYANSVPGPAGSTGKNAGSRNETKEVGGECGKCGATRVDQQIGLEPTVEAYVAQLVAVFREVRRVLRDDGVLFLNLGDSYAGGGGGNYGGQSKSTATHGDHITNVRNRDGWLSSNGLKPKDLIGIPWRVAFALQQPWLTCRGCGTENHLSQWASFPNGRRICPACELSKGHDISESGWYLRSDIIWAKPSPMPESVRDRPTKAHEYIFLLTKSPRYFFDSDAVREPHATPLHAPGNKDKLFDKEGTNSWGSDRMDAVWGNPAGRNIRSVWTIATAPFAEAHFATFPPALAERCIKAGSAPGDVVLDPFGGAGTVSLVAERLGRDSIYVDLSPEYAAMARKRIYDDAPMFAAVQST